MKAVSLKLIFRSWWRNKTFAMISLLSLAVGIACTNLLMAYVIHEFNVESTNPNKERIVCMAQDSPMTSGEKTSFVFGDIPIQLKEKYTEIKAYVRFNMQPSRFTLVNGQKFEPLCLVTTDSSFTHFFPYQAITGDLHKALSEPGKIALTETIARKFFGSQNPIGQIISIQPEQNPFETNQPTDYLNYEVTAVIKKYPQSYLHFDALTQNKASFNGGISLLLVNHPFDKETFAQRIKKDGIPTLQNEIGQYYFYSLQDSYFHEYLQEAAPYINHSQQTLLYVGFISALLILLIACFNYVNLNFSRILQQVRMIHLQKLMGASAGEINRQLFADTFLTVFIAFLVSLLITHDLLPVFNQVVSGRMETSYLFSGQTLPVIVLFILFLSVIPAVYMSRKIVRLSHSGYKEFSSGNQKRRMISILSIIQLSISIGLIFATFTVQQQLNLIDTGGERYRNLIEMGDWPHDNARFIEPFAKELRRYPELAEVTLAKGSLTNFNLRQIIHKQEDGSETYHSLAQFGGDTTFLTTLQLHIRQGIPVSQAVKQFQNPVYINEEYFKTMIPNGENPIGKPMQLYDRDYLTEETPTVIAGIIENMYTQTMEKEVFPSLTYITSEPPYNFIYIRLPERHKQEMLALLRKTWEEVNPNNYFTYQDVYAEFMKKNQRTQDFTQLLRMYALVSLLLTAFGLYGMSLYATQQRIKEIGIRKVNGATTRQIMLTLNRPFLCWITIASLIAFPITWLFLYRWLESFAYRIEISFATGVLSGIIVMAITLITTCWHTYKAATLSQTECLH